jgi:transposase
MIIIGADYHPAFQQIAFVDTETGELQERRLQHREEAEKFYRDLRAQEMKVRVGMEASGHARWFERLLDELQFELWIGDAAEKDEASTQTENGSPGCPADSAIDAGTSLSADLGAELGESRSAATAVASTPDGTGAHPDHEPAASGSAQRGLALQEAVVAGGGTGTTGVVPLAPWASQRRRDLLELRDRLNPTIAELSQAIEQALEKCPEAQRLRTHPGVGSLTALAFVLILGKADRFQCGKQIASYLGLVPLEDSSGNRRRLGHSTKQGNSVAFLVSGSGPSHSPQPPRMAQ